MRTSTPVHLAVVTLVLALLAGACSSSEETTPPTADAAPGTTQASSQASTQATSQATNLAACPSEVDAQQFATAEDLRSLATELNAFGLRSPGSDQHEASLDWLADQLQSVPGMTIAWDEYTIDRWQPTPEAPGDLPGRDLAAAGGLRVETPDGPQDIPVIGAVPFTEPTAEADGEADGTTGEDGGRGPLVLIPDGEPITTANAAGKVVVRTIPHSTIPFAGFQAIAHHVTDDLPTDGDYDRPYLRPLDETLIDAGAAGAAGVVLVWDAPTDQLRGYWDPHTGTRFAVPAVYVGSDVADRLLALVAEGAEASVTVRAAWDGAPTRNLIATLPGRTRERMVVNTNTDSVSWVQENGTVAAVALARYLGSLPTECRARDVVFALTSNHLGFSADGTFRVGPELDRGVDEGTVAFVMALEHLGTREILPRGVDGRLELTGAGEVFAWSAPQESPVLVQASVDAVQRRGLDRTAVLQGVGVPVPDQVPAICSQGGLGTNFHGLLIPTIAGISGPWSLWAPAFGERALDFDRMRGQILAFGDVLVGLDDVDRDEIAGDYLAARQARAEGAATCDLTPPPAVAPTVEPTGEPPGGADAPAGGPPEDPAAP